jgi:Tfp pilus assembly protein PilF
MYSNLGLLYHKTGHNSEASAEFRRALTLDPSNQEATEGLREIATAPK